MASEHEGQDGRRKGPLSHSPSMGQVTLPSHHPQRMNRSRPDDEPDRSRRIRLQCSSVLVRGESHLSQVMPVRGMAVRLAPDGAGFDAPLRGRSRTPDWELEMGCLFAMFAGLFPRLALFILWIARPCRIDAAFRLAPADGPSTDLGPDRAAA
jgi:hypothetical protein